MLLYYILRSYVKTDAAATAAVWILAVLQIICYLFIKMPEMDYFSIVAWNFKRNVSYLFLALLIFILYIRHRKEVFKLSAIGPMGIMYLISYVTYLLDGDGEDIVIPILYILAEYAIFLIIFMVETHRRVEEDQED